MKKNNRWPGRTVVFVVFCILLLQGCRMKVALPEPPDEMGSPYLFDESRVTSREGLAMKAAAVPGKSPSELKPSEPQVHENRQMVYRGNLSLVVDEISVALGQIQEIASESSGYMQAMYGKSIVVKIPADLFFEAILRIEALGEVINKEITGTDVTDQMFDLRTRLGSSEKILTRLLKLIDRADKVEDAIKIEKEIERVTGIIEQLKGRLRLMEERIAFSTLTVNLNSPIPQKQIKEEIPFFWVRQLGEEMLHPKGIDFKDSFWGSGVKFELPASFAKYYQKSYVTRATSADGVLIKVHRHKNVEGADLEFWTNLSRKSLLIKRGIKVSEPETLIIKNACNLKWVMGTREIGGEVYEYRVGISQTKKYVFLYEAWGKKEKFSGVEDEIMASMESLRTVSFLRGFFRGCTPESAKNYR